MVTILQEEISKLKQDIDDTFYSECGASDEELWYLEGQIAMCEKILEMLDN